MSDVGFVTLAIPGRNDQKILMLARSLRAFGGVLRAFPLYALVPDSFDGFSLAIQEEFKRLDVKVESFAIDSALLEFPFAVKVIAAAYAESALGGQYQLLSWLDDDNLIIQPPKEFLISKDKLLAYRPVHHKLIGLAWNEPQDDFWSLVYQVCDVPDGRDFLMETHTGTKIKPYFNAGTYVIQPELGILHQWQELFLENYDQPTFEAFYERNQLYTVFIHQALFTGVILHHLDPEEMRLLSPKINYPLHLHAEVPADNRPKTINELTTLRYENSFSKPDWRKKFPISEPLMTWLDSQPLAQIT